MSELMTATTFEFSEGFDHLFLNDLYAGDMLTAENIFATSLSQLALTLELADIEIRSSSPAQLRKVIHHAKPLFGYMGMLSVQDSMQQFEDLCAAGQDITVVRASYEELKSIVSEAILRASTELQRIQQYNNHQA